MATYVRTYTITSNINGTSCNINGSNGRRLFSIGNASFTTTKDGKAWSAVVPMLKVTKIEITQYNTIAKTDTISLKDVICCYNSKTGAYSHEYEIGALSNVKFVPVNVKKKVMPSSNTFTYTFSDSSSRKRLASYFNDKSLYLSERICNDKKVFTDAADSYRKGKKYKFRFVCYKDYPITIKVTYEGEDYSLFTITDSDDYYSLNDDGTTIDVLGTFNKVAETIDQLVLKFYDKPNGSVDTSTDPDSRIQSSPTDDTPYTFYPRVAAGHEYKVTMETQQGSKVIEGGPYDIGYITVDNPAVGASVTFSMTSPVDFSNSAYTSKYNIPSTIAWNTDGIGYCQFKNVITATAYIIDDGYTITSYYWQEKTTDSNGFTFWKSISTDASSYITINNSTLVLDSGGVAQDRIFRCKVNCTKNGVSYSDYTDPINIKIVDLSNRPTLRVDGSRLKDDIDADGVTTTYTESPTGTFIGSSVNIASGDFYYPQDGEPTPIWYVDYYVGTGSSPGTLTSILSNNYTGALTGRLMTEDMAVALADKQQYMVYNKYSDEASTANNLNIIDSKLSCGEEAWAACVLRTNSFSDTYSYLWAYDSLDYVTPAIFINASGNAIAFGKASTATSSEKKFECAWDTTIDGNLTVTGNLTYGNEKKEDYYRAVYSNSSNNNYLESGFSGSNFAVVKNGKNMYIYGTIVNSSQVLAKSSTVMYPVAQLPVNWKPSSPIHLLVPIGNTVITAVLTIGCSKSSLTTSGRYIALSKCRKKDAFCSVAANNSFYIGTSWISSEIDDSKTGVTSYKITE